MATASLRHQLSSTSSRHHSLVVCPLIRARQAEHVLRDVSKYQIGRDRRDTREPRFAPLALDVVFAGEAETAMRLHARFRSVPHALGGEIARHVRFGAAR